MKKAAGQAMSPEVRNVVLVLIVGGIAAILDSTMITIAINTLVDELGSSTDVIQWVATGYLLAMAVTIPITGWVERLFGGKGAWILALLIFAIGSILCATAWNDNSLIAFRVIQGSGGGLIMPLMQTLAVRAAGGRPTTRLMATVTVPVALGPILGPMIGGVILNWLSWHWLFLVNVPLLVIGILLAWGLMPSDRPALSTAPRSLDWIGLLLLAPALAVILLGLSRLSEEGGLSHVSVWLPLGVGVGLLGVFLAWALRAGEREPIVDVRLLGTWSLGIASAVMFTAGAAMYAGMFLLPLYFQQLHGQGVLEAGLLMIPQGVGALVARLVIGRLVDRHGARAVTIGSFLLAVMFTIPFAYADSGTSLLWLGIVLCARGLGIGAVLIPPMSVAYQDVDPADIAHASMNTRILQQLGASFGTAIVAVALQSLLSAGVTAAFQGAFWWTIGVTLVALIPAIALPSRTKIPNKTSAVSAVKESQ